MVIPHHWYFTLVLMNTLSILLELGVEDNPIWVWLLSRYGYLKNKLIQTFERARIEIEGTKFISCKT